MIYKIYNDVTMKWIDSEDFFRELMKDPEYRREYEALDVEYQIIDAILRKRIELDMTQADLARKMKSGQATISRLEAGTYNPSIKYLKRVAKALGARLQVTFV